MKPASKPPRAQRPAQRGTGHCSGRAQQPDLTPPGCCPPPGDRGKRSRIERRAEIAQAGAGSDRARVARARAEREDQLLAADIKLAERRARALECGIECLEEDIEHTRARAKRERS